jgi:PAS domain S-box-containing protein
VAVTTVDRDGRCTFAGGSVFSHFGLDPTTIVGLTLSDSFADRPDFIELWTRALEEDVQTDLEYGGRSIHVRCGPYRLTPDAEIIGVLVVAFDNTERVAADRALRQSEEVFRVLFEQSAVGISLQELPRDGLPGRARWNNRMRELLGMDADPDGAWWTSLVPGDEQLPMEAEYRRLLSGEITELRERRMLTRPDGAMVWADLSTVLVRDRQQQPLRIQTMALDITAQVEADRALRQSQAEAEQHMSRRRWSTCASTPTPAP